MSGTNACGRGVSSRTARRRTTSGHPSRTAFPSYLDGLFTAPDEYDQQTIIGGDEAVPIIALASIAAKVVRDRLMTRLAKQFPEYGFEKHKGYGTKSITKRLKDTVSAYPPPLFHPPL